MFFKFICATLGFFLLTGNAYAQEEPVAIRHSSEVINTYCAVAKDLRKAQKDETRIFMGIIDQFNILQVSTREDGFCSITVENASGISCIYFMGQMGTIFKKESKKDTLALTK